MDVQSFGQGRNGSAAGLMATNHGKRVIKPGPITSFVHADDNGVRWLSPGLQSSDVDPNLNSLLFSNFSILYRAEKDFSAEVKIGANESCQLDYKDGDLIAAANSESRQTVLRTLRNANVSRSAVSVGIGGKQVIQIASRGLSR